MAVVDPPLLPASDHQDDKRKKKKDGDGNEAEVGEEWTAVKGGFLPNIFRRRRRQKSTTPPFTASKASLQSTEPKLKPKEKEIHTIPNVTPVDNIVDYKAVVVDEENSIVVVRFFASWCRSCKASEPLFRNVVSQYSSPLPADGDGVRRGVKFVTVQLTKDTAYLQEGLGVPSIPYVHVYHPEGGLVEERKFSKRYYAEFTEVLESYVVGSCDLPLEEKAEDNEGEIVGVFE